MWPALGWGWLRRCHKKIDAYHYTCINISNVQKSRCKMKIDTYLKYIASQIGFFLSLEHQRICDRRRGNQDFVVEVFGHW